MDHSSDHQLLHRRMPAAAVLAGIVVTLQTGSTSPEPVAIEARKAASAAERPSRVRTPAEPLDVVSDPTAAAGGATVLTVPVRRLPADARPGRAQHSPGQAGPQQGYGGPNWHTRSIYYHHMDYRS